MKDKDGNKFYADKEKCQLMEQTWRDVFRMTEEEEYGFDKKTLGSHKPIYKCKLK